MMWMSKWNVTYNCEVFHGDLALPGEMTVSALDKLNAIESACYSIQQEIYRQHPEYAVLTIHYPTCVDVFHIDDDMSKHIARISGFKYRKQEE